MQPQLNMKISTVVEGNVMSILVYLTNIISTLSSI